MGAAFTAVPNHVLPRSHLATAEEWLRSLVEPSERAAEEAGA
jgi:hypothetical protein